MLNAAQFRQACALLRWGSSKFVQEARVSYEDARRVREEESIAALSRSDLLPIRSAMEKAGVEFMNGRMVCMRAT